MPTVKSITIRVGGPPPRPTDATQRIWTALRVLARASGPVDAPTLAMSARVGEARVAAYLRLLLRAGYATALDARDGGSPLWRLDRDTGPLAPRRCLTVMHDANAGGIEPIGRPAVALRDDNLPAAAAPPRDRTPGRRQRLGPRAAVQPNARSADVAQRVWDALRSRTTAELEMIAHVAGAARSSTLDYLRVLARAGYIERYGDLVRLLRDTGPIAPRQAVRTGARGITGVLVDANLGTDVHLPHRAAKQAARAEQAA